MGKKSLAVLTLCAAMGTPPVSRTEQKKAPHAASPQLAAIRRVYVSGQKKSQVGWAKKRLGRFTCLAPVDTIEKADAILDLEPVDTPAPVEVASDRTGVVTCRSRIGDNSSEVSCSDLNGSTEKIVCHTNPNGDTTCRSSYIDLSGLENALYNWAQRSEAAAKTHAYLLSKDGKHVLWDYDEFLAEYQSFFTHDWQGQLKHAVGCAKHERAKRHD